MSDVICPKCLEPWDNDEIHEAVSERKANGDNSWNYDKMYKLFREKGCGAVFGGNSCKPSGTERSKILGELAEMMGDDSDGYISLVEDFGLDRVGEYDG